MFLLLLTDKIYLVRRTNDVLVGKNSTLLQMVDKSNHSH